MIRCRELVERVTDYLDGALAIEDRRAIDDHLHTCEGCTAYVEQIQATSGLIRRLADH